MCIIVIKVKEKLVSSSGCILSGDTNLVNSNQVSLFMGSGQNIIVQPRANGFVLVKNLGTNMAGT